MSFFQWKFVLIIKKKKSTKWICFEIMLHFQASNFVILILLMKNIWNISENVYFQHLFRIYLFHSRLKNKYIFDFLKRNCFLILYKLILMERVGGEFFLLIMFLKVLIFFSFNWTQQCVLASTKTSFAVLLYLYIC